MENLINFKNSNNQINKITTIEEDLPCAKNIQLNSDEFNPWVEKYRPQSLDDVVYQSNVVESLKKSIKYNKMQHLLFYGPPGTGKTSTILAAAKEMFGSKYRSRILELNASDERGINVIREKIKAFATKKISNIDETTFENNNTTNFLKKALNIQIIILDEADMMTNDAQSALRRIIEDNSKTTRFCLICNYLTKIIDPISSRCAKFMFNSLPKHLQIHKINQILEFEDLKNFLNNDILEYIVDVSEGDLRRSINQVQTICGLYVDKNNGNLLNNKINTEDLEELCGIISESRIKQLLKNLLKKDIATLNVYNIVTEFCNDGYDAIQLIKQLNDYFINSEYGIKTIKQLGGERVLIFFLELMIDAENSCIEGANPELALSDLFCRIINYINKIN